MRQLAPRTLSKLLCAGITLLLISYHGEIWSKGKNNASQTTATDTVTPKKKTATKVTYQRSTSEETPAQRDKRMYRECKGMHNAGACRGYTRK